MYRTISAHIVLVLTHIVDANTRHSNSGQGITGLFNSRSAGQASSSASVGAAFEYDVQRSLSKFASSVRGPQTLMSVNKQTSRDFKTRCGPAYIYHQHQRRIPHIHSFNYSCLYSSTPQSTTSTCLIDCLPARGRRPSPKAYTALLLMSTPSKSLLWVSSGFVCVWIWEEEWF